MGLYTGRNLTRPKMKISMQKQLLLVLLLTSVFWIAMDLLFLFYQQKLMIDLDIIVINGRQSVKSDVKGTFTPPKPHLLHFIPLPPELDSKQSITLNEKDQNEYELDELYPNLVIENMGNNGLPVILPAELKDLSDSLFKNHSYDSVLSDHLSLNRKLEDVRGEKCVSKHSLYSNNLPTTTVIICFHNEALTALFRTIHSVINRTPPQLLKSVILVDDASTVEVLNDNAMNHLKGLNNSLRSGSSIIILRNEQREGLVRSRLKGAGIAKGDVLTFLDSHCEVTIGWIEPLLDRIRENKRNVVCPVIEVIDPVDFSYKKSLLEDVTQVGGFTWDLFFIWKEISSHVKKKRKDGTDPLRSPTMAGGLFSIDKLYFYEMGSYDEEMEIWGGENLEMSFRIWTCGGNLEIIPCSRVGHIFRKENSPYSFPNGVSKTLAKNFNRLADVWMDEYKELYYRRKPRADRMVDIGNIRSRVELRKRLGCKPFKWYLDNIIPDMQGADPNPPAHGQIRNNLTNMCVDSMGNKGNRAEVKTYQCHGQGGNQFFVMSKKGEIIFNDANCLDYSTENENNRVEMWNCHGLGGNQEWEHDWNTGLVKHMVTQRCLVKTENDNLTVEKCDENKTQQSWVFANYQKSLW